MMDHIVIINQKSMLAIGTVGASDYASLCGHVPDSWDVALSPPPGPADVCQKCAKTALNQDAQETLGVDDDFLFRAARLPGGDADD